MYLKRLELQGFKSFRARTLFEFGPGITAIVGPNGSGKSNVAESIRWVLGEQHARNVRARRLEDVIFSGSSQRAAVGMAEVSITLDNSEGWLPIDYSEVVVTRRAFRSGESEYLINKNKVRLRDVQDLLLRAEVGQNSYAFMGQGLVDEVLVMRPEERRRLLEEAADVRLLRARLDEARDRLAATRDNLGRVQLLLDEIGPRMRQLERQASRAVEHARLAAELAATLRELYTKQWQKAHASLAAARATLDQKHQALALARRTEQECEQGLAALSSAVEEREREVAVRRQRRRAAADEVHVLEQQVSLDRQRLDDRSRRKAEFEAELLTLREEAAQQQLRLNEAQQRAEAVQLETAAASERVAERRRELAALEQEQNGLQRAVMEAQERLNRARRGIEEAQAALFRLEQEDQRERADAERRVERRRRLLEQLAHSGREYLELRSQASQLERDLAAAERERAGLAGMVEGNRSLLQTLENEARQLEAELNQLLLRRELLWRLHSAQQGIDGGVRHLLGIDADGGQQREAAAGLIGLMREVVRVPPGLELAIEAALAENVQALVFEDMDAAVAALHELTENEAGRVLAYALDNLRVTPPANILRERGVFGVAARLVRCDNRFRPLVDMLLGRTIVVEGLELAQEVLRRGIGSVVTTSGFLLRPNGAIAGGINRASAESFARLRELEELPGLIAAAEARKQDADARLRREREGLSGASAALAELEPQIEQLRRELARAQKALMENRGRLILLRSEASGLWQELRRGGGDFERQERRSTLLAEIARFEDEAEVMSAGLEAERASLNALMARRNAAVDAVSEAVAAYADLQGEAQSLQHQLDLARAGLERTLSRARAREEALADMEREGGELLRRLEEAADRLALRRQELEALEAEMVPAEGELSHLQARERSMRDQLAAARAALLEAERAALEAESAEKLRRDEIEALRELMASEGFRAEGQSVVQIGSELDEPSGGRLPPVRGGAEVDLEALRSRIARLRSQIRALGPVNEQAQADYNESKQRYDFLQGQVEDLRGSEETLLAAIAELEENIRERLKETFVVVDREFQRYFQSFFNGGSARLILTQPDDYANSGIELSAQPPGKRVNTLAMLSGGERALTALALLLSLLEAHPSPICVLDEVDAALDETNVGRFVEALKALEKRTQFIIITHNPRTMEAADSIYGVSMGSDSTSRILSLRLSE